MNLQASASIGKIASNTETNPYQLTPLLVHEVPCAANDLVELQYAISDVSSFSANYFPENIKYNLKHDQSSRWSSATNNNMQFLTVKLERDAILQHITFGKFNKVHVCNLKEFKVFAGATADHMYEVLHAGLRNDTESETFVVRHAVKDVVFHTRFVKIVPMAAWGSNFNFSIWYLRLAGIADDAFVERAKVGFASAKQLEGVRLCMKFLRKSRYFRSLEALKAESRLAVEEERLVQLQQLLCGGGDRFQGTDALFGAIHSFVSRLPDETFAAYIEGTCKYRPQWSRIDPAATSRTIDSDASTVLRPSRRGGHQMCIDATKQHIYLFGGWDGAQDLSDFWLFDVAANSWRLLAADTRDVGGPSPRSCHKMVFDAKRRIVYVLGKYVDTDSRLNGSFCCDFFGFDVDLGKWFKISDDTKNEGGPSLLYDHQMLVNTCNDCLVVFGGKSIEASVAELEYSGLYVYHIATNRWTLVRSDTSMGAAGDDSRCVPAFPARIGHSMLLDEEDPFLRRPLLWIFGGQRNKDYLGDMHAYDMQADAVVRITKDIAKAGGPEAGFTQRATIDLRKKEIYVMSGLTKEKATALASAAAAATAFPADTLAAGSRNHLWCYSIKKDTWEELKASEDASSEACEPCPRYAYQLIYDATTGFHYLFGGNPGESGNPRQRLDDFWRLTLQKPTPSQIKAKLMFLIMRQKFYELIFHNQHAAALAFLQGDVFRSVNHKDAHESKEFKRLARCFFKSLPDNFTIDASRLALYEEIVAFFPESAKQPKHDLTELLAMNL